MALRCQDLRNPKIKDRWLAAQGKTFFARRVSLSRVEPTNRCMAREYFEIVSDPFELDSRPKMMGRKDVIVCGHLIERIPLDLNLLKGGHDETNVHR